MNMNKALGFSLVGFSVIQAYIWVFGFVSFTHAESGFYFVMLCAEFVIGLLMADVLYVK